MATHGGQPTQTEPGQRPRLERDTLLRALRSLADCLEVLLGGEGGPRDPRRVRQLLNEARRAIGDLAREGVPPAPGQPVSSTSPGSADADGHAPPP